jgi:RNA polymerase sigma-70 factor (ECF subfamily)
MEEFMSTRPDETDDILMTRYRETGDEAAFETLLNRYRNEIHDFLRLHLEGPLSASVDDALQQVFLDFFRRSQQFTPRTQVRALLYKMAEIECRYVMRQAGRAKRDYRRNVPLNDGMCDRTANPATEENRIYVNELLARLPPKEAEALRLVRLEGHTAQSAADMLGLTLDTVQWRIRQALNRLRGDPDLGPATT